MQLHKLDKEAGGGEIFWTRLGDFSDYRSSLWSTAGKGRGLNGERRMGDVSERFGKGRAEMDAETCARSAVSQLAREERESSLASPPPNSLQASVGSTSPGSRILWVHTAAYW